MRMIIAGVSTFLTVGGTLSTLWYRVRIPQLKAIPIASAALVAAIILYATGHLGGGDLEVMWHSLWRPLVSIGSIILTATVAHQLGVFQFWTDRLCRARPSATELFASVFWFSALAATLVDNDAAVLVLTPLVVGLTRRLFPMQPRVVEVFVFAVFLSAGVAPLMISNPMNMVFASYAGLSFNAYAARMVPIALLAAAVSFSAQWLMARKILAQAELSTQPLPPATPFRWDLGAMNLLLVVEIGAFVVLSALRVPVWGMALSGALLALVLLAGRRGVPAIGKTLSQELPWGIFLFLMSVFLVGKGLQNLGIVGDLQRIYRDLSPVGVGVISALGSAILNNHPMAILNMLALDGLHDPGHARVFAALIGGDLGPRLLPMGSLAGLLWLETLRRQQIDIPVERFVKIGFTVMLPSLAAALWMLT